MTRILASLVAVICLVVPEAATAQPDAREVTR
jgi:hypothetical protein